MRRVIIYSLIFILALLFFILYTLTYEPFETIGNITFMNSNETKNVLISDDDNYYATFSEYDLLARHVKTINEYKKNIINSPTNATYDLRNKITICIKNIEKNISKIEMEGFDSEKFNNIHWKVGFFSGKEYENGLPHTRGDIIIMPVKLINEYNEKRLTELMAHEMIHIYQKIYPDEVQKYLQFNNIDIQEGTNRINDFRRANPDINRIDYKDDKSLYFANYKDKNPNNVDDVIFSHSGTQEGEHPYEKMSIEFENKISEFL